MLLLVVAVRVPARLAAPGTVPSAVAVAAEEQQRRWSEPLSQRPAHSA
jgi:hypothetical protein